MTQMNNPPHPCQTPREDVLLALGLTVPEAAEALCVTRPALLRVLNSRAAISPEMALRIEGWLGVANGGRSDTWLGQQAAYDLWKARKAGAPKVRRAKITRIAEVASMESVAMIAGDADPKWMRGFGSLSSLHFETERVQVNIAEAFSVIEVNSRTCSNQRGGGSQFLLERTSCD